MSVVQPTGIKLLDSFYFSIQLYLLLFLSLFYFLFVSKLCTRKPYINKLRISCQLIICLPWSKREIRVRLVPSNLSKRSSKKLSLTVPRWCFWCGSFLLFVFCMCLPCCHVCFLQPCGHFLGTSWPLGSLASNFLLLLSLFHIVAQFMCGI